MCWEGGGECSVCGRVVSAGCVLGGGGECRVVCVEGW